MRIKRGENMCHIEGYVSYPVIERKTPNTGTCYYSTKGKLYGTLPTYFLMTFYLNVNKT